MVDKYRCYGKDDFGHPYDAFSMKDEYGEWVRTEDYDALAADLATERNISAGAIRATVVAEARVAALEAALREIQAIDYKTAATTGAACQMWTIADTAIKGTTPETPVSTLCAVCDQIKELHPNTHPWTPRAKPFMSEEEKRRQYNASDRKGEE